MEVLPLHRTQMIGALAPSTPGGSGVVHSLSCRRRTARQIFLLHADVLFRSYQAVPFDRHSACSKSNAVSVRKIIVRCVVCATNVSHLCLTSRRKSKQSSCHSHILVSQSWGKEKRKRKRKALEILLCPIELKEQSSQVETSKAAYEDDKDRSGLGCFPCYP